MVFLPRPLWIWALFDFLFLLLGFRLPLFLLPLWVRFLVGVAGFTLFNLTDSVGVSMEPQLPDTGAVT